MRVTAQTLFAAVLAAAMSVAGVAVSQDHGDDGGGGGDYSDAGYGDGGHGGADYSGGGGDYGDAGGGDCDCGPCCPPFILYMQMDEIFLQRERPSRQDFAVVRTAGDPRLVLSTNDLNFDMEATSRFAIGAAITDTDLFEISYIGLTEWTESAAVVSPQAFGLFSPFSNFSFDPRTFTPFSPFTNSDRARFAQIQMRSELHSAEANLMQQCWSCAFAQAWTLAGVRYLRYEEQFQYDTVTAVGGTSYRVETDNDLIGFQLGTQGRLHVAGPLLLEGWFKAGLYAALTDQESSLISGQAFANEIADDDDIALVTDAMLTASYDIFPWCTLRGGYYVLYVDGIASAVENMNFTLPGLAFRPAQVDNSGAVFHHGPFGGVEMRW